MLPAVALALLGGCASRDPAPGSTAPPSPSATAAPATDPEHTQVLRLDKPVRLEAGRLEIVWLSHSDSRCPIGVTCVWAGEVTVTLQVTEEGEEPASVKLSLWPGKEEAASASLHAFGLRLESVDPYPREGVRTRREDFRAVVSISRLD